MAQDPKLLLERMDTYSPEQKLNIITTLFHIKQREEMKKGTAQFLTSEQINSEAKRFFQELEAGTPEQRLSAITTLLNQCEPPRTPAPENKSPAPAGTSGKAVSDSNEVQYTKEDLQHELRQLRQENQRLQEQCKDLRQSLNIERGVVSTLKARQESSDQGKEIENLRRQIQKLVTENLHLKQDAEKEAADLRQQIAALQERLASAETPAHAPAPAPADSGEKRRIEQVLNAYLTAMSAADEQELAARFRETAFALMDCSAEEAAKVMRSPVIGTDLNKRLLRNQARRSNRMDIAQTI